MEHGVAVNFAKFGEHSWVEVVGEDANGEERLAFDLRNALLPQMTALALSVGTIVSGSLLVEAIFRYPGIGSLLFSSISSFDYPGARPLYIYVKG